MRLDRVQSLVAQKKPGAKALDYLVHAPKGPEGAVYLLRLAALAFTVLLAGMVIARPEPTNAMFIGAAAVGVVLLLAVVHAVAKAFAGSAGESIALATAGLARILTTILSPVLAIDARAARRKRIINGETVIEVAEEPASDELPVHIHTDGEPIDQRTVSMIRGVVELDETMAREIMVPRVDIVAAEIGTPITRLAEQMVESGHSRLPVYEGNLDHIVGIAYARDILDRLSKSNGAAPKPEVLTSEIVRPAIFIPEVKTLEELLKEFQEKRVQLAIVVDEYGGVSGLVTIEDLLEEIVGEIQDEFDSHEAEITTVSEGEFLVEARYSIWDLNEILKVTMENDGYDTVGGFVQDRLGKIPTVGDVVEYDGIRIEVVSTMGRRLKQLRVTKLARSETGVG
ncbi:MAG: HlyC/CorC family transporter [SAR202 cluster bacterium]|nr:HlyC/CorC family transporter [SAR202 cluster bacterium]